MNDPLQVLAGALAVVLLVVAVLTIRDIFRRGLGITKASAWVLIVVLAPPVGAIAYWATRTRQPAVAPSRLER